MTERYDVVVVGGGHNGLVAAAMLGRAGKRVLLLERSAALGGATRSVAPFPGVDVRLSRYAYLVSLLPDPLVADLGLRFTLTRRRVSSYTPVADGSAGLYVGRGPGEAARTAASFAAVTGDPAEHGRFVAFGERLARFAAAVAPTLLGPLPSEAELRARLGDDELWHDLVEAPIAATVDRAVHHDLVRGVVLTDAMIGTDTDGREPGGPGNRCFWYHVVGNGDGDWKVPVGGMGRLVEELARVAAEAGVTIRTSAPVTGIATDGREAEVVAGDGIRAGARWVLCNAAPRILARLLGEPAPDPGTGSPVPQAGAGAAAGCQVKLNMVLTRLPRLRSGDDPADAFAGTFHLDESATQLAAAHAAARSGRLPEPAPAELYCHSLTDPTILGPGPRTAGWHTLTLFGLHTPADLFRGDPDGARTEIVRRYLAGLDRVLLDPIEECLAVDAEDRPCLEASTPLDLDRELDLPDGNIFHTPLDPPFAVHEGEVGTWGVATHHANVLLCGSGARRGGGVSGIPGHNAARAVLAADP